MTESQSRSARGGEDKNSDTAIYQTTADKPVAIAIKWNINMWLWSQAVNALNLIKFGAEMPYEKKIRRLEIFCLVRHI
jgi:hypothetical protein